MAVYDGKLYLAWVATDGTNHLYVSTLQTTHPDGSPTWSNGLPVKTEQSQTAPAMAGFTWPGAGNLYPAWVAADGTKDIYFSSLKSWYVDQSGSVYWYPSPRFPVSNQNAPQKSGAAAAMASSKDKLYLAFVATDGTNDLFVCSAPPPPPPQPPPPGSPPTPWPPLPWTVGYPVSTKKIRQQSATVPAMASRVDSLYGDVLHLAFVATDRTNDLYVCTSFDGVNWTVGYPVSNQSVPQKSGTAPAMASLNDNLYLAFVATDGTNDLYVCYSPPPPPHP